MSAIIRAHYAARWLFISLFLGVITAAVAFDAGANPNSEKPTRADQPLVVALAAPVSPAPVAAPDAVTRAQPIPAQFFTIREILARNGDRLHSALSTRLASIDSSQMAPDLNNFVPSERNRSGEPFGFSTFVAPDGLLWTKWRKVTDDIRAAEAMLMHCIADATQCSPAAARFSAIINDAHSQKGRARLELVNQRVNDAIRYKNDLAQWGVPDLWSAPLDAHDTGSFSTGFGDCEDYAIAKYVALLAAGVPAQELRILLVHDNGARMGHAVLAAHDDGRWLILDNRWMNVVEDTDARQFVPLFVLEEQGVKLVAIPYAALHTPPTKPSKTIERILVPGTEITKNFF